MKKPPEKGAFFYPAIQSAVSRARCFHFFFSMGKSAPNMNWFPCRDFPALITAPDRSATDIVGPNDGMPLLSARAYTPA